MNTRIGVFVAVVVLAVVGATGYVIYSRRAYVATTDAATSAVTRNDVAAKAQGITTRALVDQHAAEFKQMADTWQISYDRFIRTIDPDHVAGVQEFVRRWIAKRRQH